MKKPLIFFALSFTLVGCGFDLGEPPISVNYIYVNNCSTEITVRSVIPDKADDNEYSFTLPVNGQHTMTFTDGYDRLFYWSHWGTKDDYVIVTNGTKTVTHHLSDEDGLYLLESYTLISDVYGHRIMQYVFTDEFFENEETIK